MKNLLLFIAMLCLIATTAIAQNDTITREKKGVGKVYMQNGRILSMRMLERSLQGNDEATRELKKGKTNVAVASGLSFAGGFVIGYEPGTALGSGKPIDLAVIGAGAGFVVIAIPFTQAGQKHIKNAVGMYNRSKRKTAMHFDPDFKLAFTGTGLGLRIGF